MKITKKQLKRIIREEREKLIQEQNSQLIEQPVEKVGVARATVLRAIPQGEKIWAALSSLIDQALDQARSPEEFYELAAELRGYADDVEDSSPE